MLHPSYQMEPDDKIARLRKCVAEHSCFQFHRKTKIMTEVLDGSYTVPKETDLDWMDVQTANAILTVYDALQDPKNRERLAAMPFENMASISWKLVKVKS